MRHPSATTVSEPSMPRTAAATSCGTADSASSASWLSSTTPAAPPATAAPAVRRPIPPQAHTGTWTSGSPSSCCSSTKVLNSPTRPPLSPPRAISPCAPARTAARACGRSVTSTSRRYSAASAATSQPGVSTASTSRSGLAPPCSRSSPGVSAQPGPTRRPKRPVNRSPNRSWRRASCSRERWSPMPRSSTPRAPARHTASASPASGRWNGVIPMTSSVSGEIGGTGLMGSPV